MLTIEQRLSNLENLVNALSKKIDSIKYYQDADIGGVRQGVSEITPYTETKTAYIEDTEVTFLDVPNGNISVFMTDSDNQDVPCEYERINSSVRVMFEVRHTIATVTIQVS